MGYKTRNKKRDTSACPVPFPEKLVYRVLKFYSYKEDVVLDPFGGSGTVSYISALINRKSIYIDNSKKSFEFAVKRTKEAVEKNAIFEYVGDAK